MKKLKIILAVLLTLALFLVAFAYTLPATWSVERSITINAEPETIYPHLANLKNWKAWQPWETGNIPDFKITYSGPEQGPGAKQSWTSSNRSESGSLTITKAESPTLIEFELRLGADDPFKAVGRFTLEKTGPATKLTWRDEGETGPNPLSRFVGLAIDSMMGPDFEKGLANLKKLVESPPKPQNM